MCSPRRGNTTARPAGPTILGFREIVGSPPLAVGRAVRCHVGSRVRTRSVPPGGQFGAGARRRAAGWTALRSASGPSAGHRGEGPRAGTSRADGEVQGRYRTVKTRTFPVVGTATTRAHAEMRVCAAVYLCVGLKIYNGAGIINSDCRSCPERGRLEADRSRGLIRRWGRTDPPLRASPAPRRI